MKAAEIPDQWGRPWTEEEIEYLKSANDLGESRKETARALGRSLAGVVDKIRRLDLPPRDHGHPMKQEIPSVAKIKKLLARGWTLNKIARRCGCDRKTLCYRLGTWKPQRYPSYKWRKPNEGPISRRESPEVQG